MSTADRSAAAFLRAWEYYAGQNPAGSARHLGAAHACVTGVPVSLLNGVYLASKTVDVDEVRTLLDLVSASGVPYCLQGRSASVELAALAADYGLISGGEAPLMVLDPARLVPLPAVADLMVHELGPTAGHVHHEVMAAGFGAPRELMGRLVPPELLAGSPVRVYAGLVGGRAVSTGMAILLDDTVGVFNIATVPEDRGKGYGGAVTARLVADAFSAGATLACLQSSPEGLRVYQRLGFEIAEQWPWWSTAP